MGLWVYFKVSGVSLAGRAMKLPSHEKFSDTGKKMSEVLQNQDGLRPPTTPKPWSQRAFVSCALSLQADKNIVKAFAEEKEALTIYLHVNIEL